MLVVVTLLLAPLVALAVHEAGHALAALALGGRGLRVRWIPWGAAVEASFDDAIAARRVAFLLAGPLASALFGAALIGAGGPAGVAGLVSVAFAALTLGGTDGKQAWVAWSRAKSNDSR